MLAERPGPAASTGSTRPAPIALRADLDRFWATQLRSFQTVVDARPRDPAGAAMTMRHHRGEPSVTRRPIVGRRCPMAPCAFAVLHRATSVRRWRRPSTTSIQRSSWPEMPSPSHGSAATSTHRGGPTVSASPVVRARWRARPDRTAAASRNITDAAATPNHRPSPARGDDRGRRVGRPRSTRITPRRARAPAPSTATATRVERMRSAVASPARLGPRHDRRRRRGPARPVAEHPGRRRGDAAPR